MPTENLKFTPSFEEARRISEADPQILIPIYSNLPEADLYTPVLAFSSLNLKDKAYSFLFESVSADERIGRWSYLGVGEQENPIIIEKDSAEDPKELILSHLNRRVANIADLPPFHGGLVGYLGYDLIRRWEPKVPPHSRGGIGVPDGIQFHVNDLVAIDHLRRQTLVITHMDASQDPMVLEQEYRQACERISATVEKLRTPFHFIPEEAKEKIPAETTFNMTEEEFEEAVRQAKEKDIKNGEYVQAVLSLRAQREIHVHPFEIYRKLRTINPSPFMSYINFGNDFYIVGASPELLIRSENKRIINLPLAGTRPRGKTLEEDLAYEDEFLHDYKEQSEHIMLVDLHRAEVGRVAKPGTVKTTSLMVVVRYPTVMHMESVIEGELADGLTPFDALISCFPAGTVSGEPKVRAMTGIAEYEVDGRGPYAGTYGFFKHNGDYDQAITIRTIIIKNFIAYIQAGAGIVHDSIPEREYQECMTKLSAQLRAVQMAEEG